MSSRPLASTSSFTWSYVARITPLMIPVQITLGPKLCQKPRIPFWRLTCLKQSIVPLYGRSLIGSCPYVCSRTFTTSNGLASATPTEPAKYPAAAFYIIDALRFGSCLSEVYATIAFLRGTYIPFPMPRKMIYLCIPGTTP